VFAVVVLAFALPVGVARTEDQLQRISQRQARGGIAGLLGDGALAGQLQRSPVRLREITGPAEVAGQRQVLCIRIAEVWLEVTMVGELALVVAQAGHELVFAAEQLERTVDVAINAVDLALGVVEAGHRRDAGSRGLVECGIGRIEQLVIGLGAVVGGADLELPAVAEGVLQGGERTLAGGIPVGPVRRRIERGRIVRRAAIGVPHREAAPGRAIGALLLVVVAHAQLRVRGQVGVDDSVAQRLSLVVAVHLAVGIQVAADYAAAHRATGVERAAHVHGGAGAAPAADVH